MRLTRQRLARLWVYFRRGHSTYMTFLISFANFVAIQYELVVSKIEPLRAIFSHMLVFALAFLALYVPAAILIGWLDYRRISVPVEVTLGTMANPWVRDVATALVLLIDGRVEEARKLLEKWADKRTLSLHADSSS